eukprot:PhF_6_TR31853/c1_g1_i1/m.47234/K05674/ABCC10; ATP-binding cassette, subfamily C (CFTR/MRP), member 10
MWDVLQVIVSIVVCVATAILLWNQWSDNSSGGYYGGTIAYGLLILSNVVTVILAASLHLSAQAHKSLLLDPTMSLFSLSIALIVSGLVSRRLGPKWSGAVHVVLLSVLFYPTWTHCWDQHKVDIYHSQTVLMLGVFVGFCVLLGTPVPPYGEESLASSLTFAWVDHLLTLGAQRPLQHADCFGLPPDIVVSTERWNFFQKCGTQYIGLGVLKFCCDNGGFVAPLLLNEFLTYLESDSSNRQTGWLIVIGLLSSNLVLIVLRAQYDFYVRRLSYRVQSNLITSVFKTTIVTPTHDLHGYASGDVMNYMGVDTQRVADAVPSFNEFWSLPIQVGITLYLLYVQVSWAFLSGLGVVVLLVPFNMYIARRLQKETRKMMTAKDTRVNSVSEFIRSIKVVKMQGWEPKVLESISTSRRAEFEALETRKYLDSFCVFLWATTPVLVTLSTFATYVWTGGNLTPAKAFTSITLFNMLIYPINAFPWVVNGLMEAQVSYTRIRKFLSLARSTTTTIKHRHLAVTVNSMATLPVTSEHFKLIDVSQAYFTFHTNCAFKLSDVTLSLSRGELVGVLGPHASGKSALLRALNGHMKLMGGYSVVRGSVGYVSQEPFLLCDTIRENILFGSEYRHEEYVQSIVDCALDVDLGTFPEGDQTFVGGSGMTLSGGQKMRVSLARALYQSHCSVYLLDDVLSCLDGVVAAHVFNLAILERLVKRGKCVVLVTHDEQYLSACNFVWNVSNGRVKVRECSSNAPSEERGNSLPNESSFSQSNRDASILSKMGIQQQDTAEAQIEVGTLTQSPKQQAELNAEHREVGNVDAEAQKFYFRSVGWNLTALVIFSVLVMQASRNACDIWLTVWVADTYQQTETFYLSCLGYLALTNAILTCVRSFLFAYAGLIGAAIIHNKLLRKVLFAPFNFFTENPPGRIVNRFSRDQFSVDEDLPFQYNIVLAQLFLLLGSVLIMSMGSWIVSLCFIPVLIVYYFVQKYYRTTSRELKRLDSTSRSPLYDRMGELMQGSQVITGFGPDAVAAFLHSVCHSLRINLRANYNMLAASEWFNLRLQMLGFCMLTTVTVVGMLEFEDGNRSQIGAFGLALSYAIPITSYLAGLVNSYAEFEKQFISVERIYEYCSVKEDDEGNEGKMANVATSWPVHGEISYEKVSVRYQPDLEPSLVDCTVTIPSGKKYGIAGRTGSGKSTLLSSLLRLVPHITGTIRLDGVDISSVPLSRLRSSVAVITQDVVLFSGVLRHVLDPFEQILDGPIRDALQQVGMGHLELTFKVEEGGKNLSVGERQLLALAGVLLRPKKILLMDEATTALDTETEQKVFRVLLNTFRDVTVLCVSHRIENFANFDQVVVVDDGRIVRVGTPADVMQQL